MIASTGNRFPLLPNYSLELWKVLCFSFCWLIGNIKRRETRIAESMSREQFACSDKTPSKKCLRYWEYSLCYVPNQSLYKLSCLVTASHSTVLAYAIAFYIIFIVPASIMELFEDLQDKLTPSWYPRGYYNRSFEVTASSLLHNILKFTWTLLDYRRISYLSWHKCQFSFVSAY